MLGKIQSKQEFSLFLFYMHSCIYKLIISHILANHKYIKPSLQVSAHDAYQHCVGQCTPGPRQRTPSPPGQTPPVHKVNIDVICTRLQYHIHKIAISFTQDINFIYTKYQHHQHKISMSLTSTQAININHTRHQCHPHKV